MDIELGNYNVAIVGIVELGIDLDKYSHTALQYVDHSVNSSTVNLPHYCSYLLVDYRSVFSFLQVRKQR